MTLALYRRYRPETFAEVIGQEHVTDPLQQAIRNGRVHHAYLFSGPRGCGKTTSARILARALNCEAGPTPTPCGSCRSCLDLSRGGSGGLDVVEIDAASHGGVDDARDLRERAAFAPAGSRFKIYIIDEAHMVTPQGFNALLKVVEEPPEHLKFVFATTEPEKVIATIRSRTHHYPFRLVPPGVLREHLANLCEREKVDVEPAVLPLVVRAGAGSVRDSLSVLDQLIAGAGEDGVTLPRALALLGYTDAALLDDVVDAFAAHDGAAVFSLVDRVIEGGHDPRRFVTDLLDRLRDLIILAAVPDAGGTGLVDAPPDALERMVAQSGRFGRAELTRAADLVSTGLTEMRGATAPRLVLELICARVLLPGAGDGEQDVHARLDRLELRLAGGAAPAAQPAARTRAVREAPAQAAQAERRTPAPAAPAPVAHPEPGPEPAATEPVPAAPVPAATEPPPVAARDAAPTRGAEPAPAEPASVQPAPTAARGADVTTVRRLWTEVLNIVKARRRFTWMMLIDNVQVASVERDLVVLAFADEGRRKSFQSSGSEDLLGAALAEVLPPGPWRLDAVLDPGRATAGGPAPAGPAHAVGAHAAAPARPSSAPATPTAEPSRRPAAPPALAAGPPAPAAPEPPAATRPESPAPRVDPADDDSAAPDDPAADQGLSESDLLIRELGATIISDTERP